MVKVFPPIALTGPDERSVFQPDWFLVNSYPRFRSLVNDVRRLTVFRVGIVHIQKRLFAILRLVNNFLTIRTPPNARDQQIGRLIFERIDPANIAARSTNDAQLHDGIRIAGFRIRRDLDVLVVRNVIDNSELRNRIFIETKKRDRS